MKKNILFVDDEQFVLDGLGRLLREFRKTWQLRFALNGQEALDIVNDEIIDLIISDVRMPGMSGLDLLEKLQADEKTKNIPVVILTGDQERTLKRQALDLGAVDLLNKPINKEDLVARINNVLKLKEYQDIIIQKNRALEEQLVMLKRPMLCSARRLTSSSSPREQAGRPQHLRSAATATSKPAASRTVTAARPMDGS